MDIDLQPRTVRFLHLWAVNFAKIIGIILLSISIGGFIGWLIVKLTVLYGAKIVLAGIALTWVLLLCGAAAGGLASERLHRMEAEEERVMRKLRDGKH